MVRQLRTEVEDREQAFREAGHESMTDARNAGSFPDVFLFVDGWEAFKREFELLDREVEELAATGLSYGVHVVVAANRWAEIRPALLDNLGARLELRLHDAIDSLVSRQAAASLPAEVPGRGLTTEGLHFQVAARRGSTRSSRRRPSVDGAGRAADPAAAARARPAAAAAAVGPRGDPLRRRGARPGPRLDPARAARIRTSSSSATGRAASRRCCAASAAGWSPRTRRSSCSSWWSTCGAR